MRGVLAGFHQILFCLGKFLEGLFERFEGLFRSWSTEKLLDPNLSSVGLY